MARDIGHGVETVGLVARANGPRRGVAALWSFTSAARHGGSQRQREGRRARKQAAEREEQLHGATRSVAGTAEGRATLEGRTTLTRSGAAIDDWPGAAIVRPRPTSVCCPAGCRFPAGGNATSASGKACGPAGAALARTSSRASTRRHARGGRAARRRAAHIVRAAAEPQATTRPAPPTVRKRGHRIDTTRIVAVRAARDATRDQPSAGAGADEQRAREARGEGWTRARRHRRTEGMKESCPSHSP
jgi:hypothetical protein